jgi:putative tricarboxylic transport membrane protein
MTFGMKYLAGGINIIPIMIGLFAVSEIMEKCGVIDKVLPVIQNITSSKLSLKHLLANMKTIVKSSFIGTIIGAIPGTGSALASFISYNEAKRSSKNRDNFGHGELEGVAASEAGNNGVTGATLIPLLTLGIPGDTVTAVMLGALMLHGITPGPQLFIRQKEWVYLIIFGLFVINIFMYLQGKLFIKAFINVTKVPATLLVPMLFVLCFIGAYAINNTLFDVWVMIAFGCGAYILKKFDYPMPPLIIAIILGPLAESNMRRALILSEGNMMIFLTKPISAFFLVISLITFLSPIFVRFKKSGQNR